MAYLGFDSHGWLWDTMSLKENNMKIELSLTASYLREWGLQQAIREVIQNAQDSDVMGNRMTFEHKNGKLIVTNDGVVLEHNVLLLGETSKSGRSDQAGKFGEGLKLAMLVCARSKIEMRIRNGSEVWVPKIEKSDRFAGSDVLVVHIRKGKEGMRRFSVEIEFPEEVWNEEKWKYLMIERPVPGEVFNTEHGRLLKSDKHRGCVFSKGIFVCKMPGVTYGYDLPNVALDRDRRTVDMWDLKHEVRLVMNQIISDQRALKRKELYEMVQSGQGEMSVGEYDSLGSATSEAIHAEFVDRYGKNAIPVTNAAQAAELEHFGVTGVIVGSSLHNALKKIVGDVDTVRKKLASEIVGDPLWSELAPNEKANVTAAIENINLADPSLNVSLENVQIVNLRDKRLRGIFKDGIAMLSRDILSDRAQTQATLIHEVAHRKGPDGDKAHVSEIERIWTLIFRKMVELPLTV